MSDHARLHKTRGFMLGDASLDGDPMKDFTILE
eukprot:CAMPEP_0119317772 /NCGR_PEP_ID=MMETSP1333-20130426/44276_1 /TAXON_ID=418940 /ORGANISM="Scyphosphaera apsteinii, Strain RCC1455" /LENGTH=32 /DNA_ID= /DNA_START= /DNA_END= /DNA_ORIENTATION=